MVQVYMKILFKTIKLKTMIKLHQSSDGQFYFTLCGKNGKVVMTSETYPTRQNLHRAVSGLRKLITNYFPFPIKDIPKKEKIIPCKK